jgi:hypothetical protein
MSTMCHHLPMLATLMGALGQRPQNRGGGQALETSFLGPHRDPPRALHLLKKHQWTTFIPCYGVVRAKKSIL